MTDPPTRPIGSLGPQLRGLDGKDFAAYQSIRGSYAYDRFELHVDRIPKDPYAPQGTGVFRVSVARAEAGFPDDVCTSPIRAVAFRDFLARGFHIACRDMCPGRRGTGNSGIIAIAAPAQEIIERTSIDVDDRQVEARFFMGLPASGRRIDAGTAEAMLFEELPRIVGSALFAENVDLDALARHIHAAEDAEHVRGRLADLGLVAFVADGSVLPRASGIDPRRLGDENVVRFVSPMGLRVSLEAPHAGVVTGMGIPAGVTLIVGGGYHGKSTLLEAIQLGIYDHVPGDGRELCVCLPGTVKVRAASGRSVTGTDISAFIGELPLGQDTTTFSTGNASGSTSQAAFIAEAVEAGAQVLLMDEDTCAANLMVRDHRMQQLVVHEDEPIIAFVDRVRQLHRDFGVSTVLVMGGSGDYFDVADHVVQMTAFEPHDVTRRAWEIAGDSPSQRVSEGGMHMSPPRSRMPDGAGLDPRNEYGHFRISAQTAGRLVFGRTEVDLSDVEQLVEAAQVRAIGRAIDHGRRYMDGRTPLREVVDRVMLDIEQHGLDLLDPHRVGDLAGFRGLELAAALDRFRGLTWY